jgi:hypothetical protein
MRLTPLHGLALILAVYLVLGIVYAETTPIFEKPEEHLHFALARLIARERRLPAPADEELCRQECGQPPLYYALSAPLIGWIETSDYAAYLVRNPYWVIGVGPDLDFSPRNKNYFAHSSRAAPPYHGTALAVHVLRWVTLLVGGLTVVSAFGLAREFVPERPEIALGSAALTAFLPQFLFINSAVHNDGLTAALSALALWLTARAVKRGLSAKTVIVIGALTGLAVLTKLNALALIPVVLFGIALALPPAPLKILAAQGLRYSTLCLGVSAVITGWWFARSLGAGDALGVGPHFKFVGRLNALPEAWYAGFSLLMLWRSFLAAFGWAHILVSRYFYYACAAVTALGGLGWAALWLRPGLRRRLGPRAPRVLAFLVGALIVYALAVIGWLFVVPAFFGRLLFPILPVLAVLALTGLTFALPRPASALVVAVVSAGLLFFSILAPGRYILPAYATPQLTGEAAARWTGAPRFRFDERIGLQDFQLAGEPKPGGALTLMLTYRALADVPAAYKVFAHVMDYNQTQVLAQEDEFVGGSLFPSQAWRAGDVIREERHLVLPPDLPPGAYWVSTGLYDPASGQRLFVVNAQGAPMPDNIAFLTTIEVR